jgi:flagellar hook-basal body complex protein FliE
MVEFNITPIGQQSPLQPATPIEAKAKADKDSFGQWLSQSLGEVNQLQQVADSAAQKLISGESKDIHGTMIAMQKANIGLDLMLEIRNKVIAAYEEVKRMQF